MVCNTWSFHLHWDCIKAANSSHKYMLFRQNVVTIVKAVT